MIDVLLDCDAGIELGWVFGTISATGSFMLPDLHGLALRSGRHLTFEPRVDDEWSARKKRGEEQDTRLAE